MRQYYPVWHALKTKNVCVVEHHPRFFARLKKAVIKEKDLDDGFKLLCEEQGKRARISVQVIKTKDNKSALKFTLNYSLTVDDL